ncbi:hypothetical protein B1810_13995 [Panacagrimonas perspica]|nr:hypothetical protein B1810_13995 [Panacagrimonas perspica]
MLLKAPESASGGVFGYAQVVREIADADANSSVVAARSSVDPADFDVRAPSHRIEILPCGRVHHPMLELHELGFAAIVGAALLFDARARH